MNGNPKTLVVSWELGGGTWDLFVGRIPGQGIAFDMGFSHIDDGGERTDIAANIPYQIAAQLAVFLMTELSDQEEVVISKLQQIERELQRAR